MKFFKNCFKAVTAALLVLNCAYCDEILLPTDWQQKGLKGKVKKMTEIEYKYRESKLEETWIVTTEFNESGYITKMTQHINGRRNRTNVYEYYKRAGSSKALKTARCLYTNTNTTRMEI